MNNLLIFFALPIAIIILSIVLQKILNNPLLVAVTFFAILLVVSFALFGGDALVTAIVLTIIYSILSYVTASLVTLFCRLKNAQNNDCGCSSNSEEVALSATITPNSDSNGRTGNFRGCYRRR